MRKVLLTLSALLVIVSILAAATSSIQLVNATGEWYISSNGKTWHKITGQSAQFEMPDGWQSGVYDIVFRYGKQWFYTSVVVKQGDNVVDAAKLVSNGITNYGLDRSKIADSCGNGKCHGVLFGSPVELTPSEVEKILTKQVKYYVIVKTNKTDYSLARKHYDTKDVVVAAVPSEHWLVNRPDITAAVFDTGGKLLKTFSGTDEAALDAALKYVSGGSNPGPLPLPDVEGLDNFWLYVVFALLLVVVVWRSKN
jgi:hypothetical protein